MVQFAILWEKEKAHARVDKEKYTSLQAYDSEVLLDLLISWKNEYLRNSDEDDICEFFYKKLKKYLSKKK